ncbi:MAG: glycosyltransferase family 4 protein [bacterium]|nr:glycosyltransferase family 4 protein [bacterium]
MSSSRKKIKLLFITQKIHQADDDLAFVILWIKEFIKQGVDVQVVCLERGEFDDSFPVYSLGKEKGAGKLGRMLRFWQLIFRLKYNRVYVHMNPEYFTLGGWYWFLKKIPMYLWYTHYTMHFHLWLAGHLSARMFAATKQSLPQYEGSPKKIITGHGIDIDFWLKDFHEDKNNSSEFNLLTVHRICRSKRLELAIKALNFLPSAYNLTIYGRDVEKDYYGEILDLIKEEKLENRVKLMGPVPMAELKNIYHKFRIMVNMASETIDKTMLEGMLFGIFPVTTAGNSQAIGLSDYPNNDEPETLAKFIMQKKWQEYSVESLQRIVEEKHSLEALIKKMGKYIIEGN